MKHIHMQPFAYHVHKGNRVSESCVYSAALSPAVALDEKAAEEEDRHANGGGQPRRTTKEKEPEAESSTF